MSDGSVDMEGPNRQRQRVTWTRCRAHFVAEGEVTFRALLFVPRVQPADSFNRYGTKTDHIKLYVRRVFITDEFNDLMPNYLAFIQVSALRGAPLLSFACEGRSSSGQCCRASWTPTTCR